MQLKSVMNLAVSASLASCAITGAALAESAPAAFTEYVQIDGVQEFTGQMIVRPIQVKQAKTNGLSDVEIQSMRSAAVERVLAESRLVEYVWETDEYIVELPAGVSENQFAADLLATGEYDYVEPNWMVYPVYTPNDSRITSQWHHNSNRVNSYGGWDYYKGDPSVGVGICDTGVRTTHEDLLLHRLEGYNAVTGLWENQGGQINDINGHGTWCTGTAAANGDNGKGVAGMGLDLSHRMLRVTNSGGGGAYISDLTEAARTSIGAGDRCASVSYGGATSSSARSAATYGKQNGGLVFWAAGNEGSYLSGNRDNDDLLVIGATNTGDSKASFSNYGPYVDFMAPGAGIFTTSRNSNSSYGSVSGTSFSCPMAAGLGGLIFSANPTLTPDEVENILKSTATDLGANGVDDTYGYGRIDSADAMAATGSGGPRFTIFPDPPLIGGEDVRFSIENGEPNMISAIFYSTQGTVPGGTEIAPGIIIDLKNPQQIKPTRTTNANGSASWWVTLPNVNLRVFLQGAQANGDITDWLYEDIQ